MGLRVADIEKAMTVTHTFEHRTLNIASLDVCMGFPDPKNEKEVSRRKSDKEEKATQWQLVEGNICMGFPDPKNQKEL